jgi:16S rRNA (guanine1207-N2)-methyltransferase
MTILQNAHYGSVPRELFDLPPGSVQCSPQIPGASVLEGLPPGGCARLIVHAPPSTIERRAVLALALCALIPGGTLIAFAANSKGGTRIADEVQAFGCTADLSHKRRYQIVSTSRPGTLTGLDDAIAAGGPRLVPALGLWSQPGLFNWDRIDPGSQLLLDYLPALSGHGADLGCGIGVFARALRQGSNKPRVSLIDIDSRALAVARLNVPGEGVETLWADVRSARDLPSGLDFVVINPPFHDAGEEDKALGQAFISKAAGMLKPGGVLWLTANRHLPYEATLKSLFETVEQIAQAHGYKIYRALKAAAPARQATAKAAR